MREIWLCHFYTEGQSNLTILETQTMSLFHVISCARLHYKGQRYKSEGAGFKRFLGSGQTDEHTSLHWIHGGALEQIVYAAYAKVIK